MENAWESVSDGSPKIKDVAILDDRILVAQGAMSVNYRDNLPTFVFGHFLQNDNDLTVFPNPVQNCITIAFRDADTGYALDGWNFLKNASSMAIKHTE